MKSHHVHIEERESQRGVEGRKLCVDLFCLLVVYLFLFGYLPREKNRCAFKLGWSWKGWEKEAKVACVWNLDVSPLCHANLRCECVWDPVNKPSRLPAIGGRDWLIHLLEG